MKFKNSKEELTKILSRLKQEFIESGEKNPIENGLVNPEFMFYTVDRYLTMQKETLRLANEVLNKDNDDVL